MGHGGQSSGPDVPRSRPPTPEQRAKGSKATADKARAFAVRLAPILSELSALSANAVAKELERRGVDTAHGGVWSAGKVIAVRKRLEAYEGRIEWSISAGSRSSPTAPKPGRSKSITCFEELEELQGIIERGPDWNTIVSIVVTLNPERASLPGDTIEAAERR